MNKVQRFKQLKDTGMFKRAPMEVVANMFLVYTGCVSGALIRSDFNRFVYYKKIQDYFKVDRGGYRAVEQGKSKKLLIYHNTLSELSKRAIIDKGAMDMITGHIKPGQRSRKKTRYHYSYIFRQSSKHAECIISTEKSYSKIDREVCDKRDMWIAALKEVFPESSMRLSCELLYSDDITWKRLLKFNSGTEEITEELRNSVVYILQSMGFQRSAELMAQNDAELDNKYKRIWCTLFSFYMNNPMSELYIIDSTHKKIDKQLEAFETAQYELYI